MTDSVENDILTNNYSLFQQILYGGVSHGVLVIPTNFFKIIITLLFTPLGQIIISADDFTIDTFPWITWDALKQLFSYETINQIVYSFLLTSMFYIPGLIYVLSNLTTNTPNVPGTLKCNKNTGRCEDTSTAIPTETQ
jgi:uncharacterized membrane protein YqaE (UPF0057 family)